MTHDEFAQKMKKALGRSPPMLAREKLGELIRTRGTRIELRYEWVNNPRFYRWVWDCPEVDFGEGQEWITVWICEHGRQGHKAVVT